jgi:hypothetical protein
VLRGGVVRGDAARRDASTAAVLHRWSAASSARNARQIADAKRDDERADKPQHEGPRHGVDLATELVNFVERFNLARGLAYSSPSLSSRITCCRSSSNMTARDWP